jgi:hypothetical protein
VTHFEVSGLTVLSVQSLFKPHSLFLFLWFSVSEGNGMKLLKDEEAFRTWMTQDYFNCHGDIPPAFEAGELEGEIIRQMPENYPCLVFVLEDVINKEPEVLRFVTDEQVREWAKIMGIIA